MMWLSFPYWVSVWVYVPECSANGGIGGPLELESQAGVSLTWVQGTKLGIISPSSD